MARLHALAAVALLASLALAGCVNQGQGQRINSENPGNAYIVADCGIGITGNGGIYAEVRECAATVYRGTIAKTTITCDGLTDNTEGLDYGDRESDLHWTAYTPGGQQIVLTETYDIENGQSAAATCQFKIRGDKYGTYTFEFKPRCYEDSNPYWFGFQAQETHRDCNDFRDTITIGREWFQ